MSKILVKAKTNVVLMERQIRYNINYIRSLRAVGVIFTLLVPLVYALCVLAGVLPLEYQAMGLIFWTIVIVDAGFGLWGYYLQRQCKQLRAKIQQTKKN